MKAFTAVIFLGAFLVLIGMPEENLAHPTTPEAVPGPHEVWNNCGTWCESTCANPPGPTDYCIAMCKRGLFCESGYIRETAGGRCIPESECPPRQP